MLKLLSGFSLFLGSDNNPGGGPQGPALPIISFFRLSSHWPLYLHLVNSFLFILSDLLKYYFLKAIFPKLHFHLVLGMLSITVCFLWSLGHLW